MVRAGAWTPEFIFGDPTLTETGYLAQFRAPIRFAQIEDDVWGTPAAVEHMASHFTGQRRALDLDASASPTPAASRIGHLGFFREEFRDTLWPAAYDWLAGKR